VHSTYDVAIVGAGPAGSWAARSLAGRGARVLLVDGSHPREKPCGGGVTGRALRLVAEEVNAADLPIVTIRSARFFSNASATCADVPLDDDALVVASRAKFDAALLAGARRAGAQLLAERAIDIRRSRDGFELHSRRGTCRAVAVIGADGANSLVRRRLSTAFARHQLSIATGFFAHGVTTDRIDVEFVTEPPGYLWSFPRPDHLAIGICAQATPAVTTRRLQRLAADWIARIHLADGARLQPYAWPIPSLEAADLQLLAPSGPGWFLVGDAAGLVDPLTREGIYFALVSAAWAADAIASGDRESWRQYAERVRGEIGAELAMAARMKQRFYRSTITRLMIHGLRQSASIRAVLVDLIAGRQGYKGLKWRLLKTRQVRLVTRLLGSRISPPAGDDTSEPSPRP
jgi:geranylgeranyl reductase family protein